MTIFFYPNAFSYFICWSEYGRRFHATTTICLEYKQLYTSHILILIYDIIMLSYQSTSCELMYISTAWLPGMYSPHTSFITVSWESESLPGILSSDNEHFEIWAAENASYLERLLGSPLQFPHSILHFSALHLSFCELTFQNLIHCKGLHTKCVRYAILGGPLSYLINPGLRYQISLKYSFSFISHSVIYTLNCIFLTITAFLYVFPQHRSLLNHKQLRVTTWKIPPFRLRALHWQQMCFSFCSLVRFDVSWGRSARFLTKSAEERWLSGIFLTHRRKTSDLDPPLYSAATHRLKSLTHPPSPLCYCFLCIETVALCLLVSLLTGGSFPLCLQPNIQTLGEIAKVVWVWV